MDLQYLDDGVNAVQRWLGIKGIDLGGTEALEVVGFKLKGVPLLLITIAEQTKAKLPHFLA